jgi:hypothetical protein
MAKKRMRVRAKRLDQIDATKLSLAIWLIARDMVDNKTTLPKTARKHKASGPAGGGASIKEPV